MAVAAAQAISTVPLNIVPTVFAAKLDDAKVGVIFMLVITVEPS